MTNDNFTDAEVLAALNAHGVVKIGRASCRERV